MKIAKFSKYEKLAIIVSKPLDIFSAYNISKQYSLNIDLTTIFLMIGRDQNGLLELIKEYFYYYQNQLTGGGHMRN